MIERRSSRTSVAADGGRIKGTASVTYDGTPGSEFDLFGDGTAMERIAPGAFDAHLGTRPDVVALVNHDANLVLGRTTSGTLRLKTDASGLHYEIDLPDTAVARDLKVSIERGDISGSSFSFIPAEVEWQRDGNRDIRLIRQAKLYDVSPVTRPAYGSATCSLRSEERKALESERQEHFAKIATEKRLARLSSLTAQVAK